MVEERKAVHAFLSPKAHGAAQEFSAEVGVSVTGLLERLFLDIAEEGEAGIDPSASREDWVKGGRRVDADRRRRGGVLS